MANLKVYKQYPVRRVEIIVRGDKQKLVEYLEKNGPEHTRRFEKELGIVRAAICPGNPEDAYHVRVEFPICEIDRKATEKLGVLTGEIKAMGLTANETTDIESVMVVVEDYPYKEIGHRIWKLHGQEKKAYEINEESF